MPACPFERSRRRLTSFSRRKERSYPCKERGARAVIQHVERSHTQMRDANRDKARAYMRNYMRKRRSQAPG